ncbi:MAG: 16S rRNA (cytosine967-C5)-methyltransferase [Bacteroidia bacterium]|jgi:16S rRNA (cytosine967-C5)-methyltransferase
MSAGGQSPDVRANAAKVIGAVLDGQSLNQALPPALAAVAERDRALLQQLCYGTLRVVPRLVALMYQLLDKPLKDKDRDVQGLLLCGLYQLEYTRIPDHAAVAATVDASKALKKPWARGLVNAVLRRFQREGEQLAGQLSEPAQACHPKWLYKEINRQWPQAAADILAANNLQPPMTLRANTQQTTRGDYLDQLASASIAAKAGTLCPQAVCLDEPMDVAALPGFDAGIASVQDEGAQLAAILLDTQPGERVLDACAAPGGKACHILELQPELAELIATDIDGARLAKVAENLERLELCAQLIQSDGAAPSSQLAAGTFDRILVDAPCSASGVIRRHPDVKVLRRREDIAQFAQQQLEILAGLWPLLKAGGTLLYVTCSILEQENSEVMEQFLQTQEDATLIALPTCFGEETRCGRQLLPSPTGPDGLFFARLQKSS